MDTLANSLPKQGQALADKATDKANQVLNDAAPLLKSTAGQARALGRQGVDAVSNAVGQARDAAVDASDSIIAYTKKNPATALAIAAATGVVIYAAIKVLTSRRD
jgi:ElaB/YqjD/DUF883 family membrane-anchored ribosome-binding protein